MLSANLQRDQRLRACDFQLVTHSPSGRRWWRVGAMGLPILDPEQADSLVDMLVEAGFVYTAGRWRWSDGEVYSTREALEELKRETLFLLKYAQQYGD